MCGRQFFAVCVKIMQRHACPKPQLRHVTSHWSLQKCFQWRVQKCGRNCRGDEKVPLVAVYFAHKVTSNSVEAVSKNVLREALFYAIDVTNSTNMTELKWKWNFYKECWGRSIRTGESHWLETKRKPILCSKKRGIDKWSPFYESPRWERERII